MFAATFALTLQLAAAPLPVIANPASTYCIAIGGRLDIVNTARGQVGYCILKNGRRVEEWALYRRAMKRKAMKERQ